MSTADIGPDILKMLNAFFREGTLRSSHWRHRLLEETAYWAQLVFNHYAESIEDSFMQTVNEYCLSIFKDIVSISLL